MSPNFRTLLFVFALIGFSVGGLLPVMNCAQAAEEDSSRKETVRLEVGKPLQAAQDLISAKKYKEALSKIDEADAVSNKTPFESYLVVRTRGAAAFSDGQLELAAQAFESAMGFNRLNVAEFQEISRALAGNFYRKPDYANAALWATRYLEKGGPDPQIKVLLAQSYYLMNDYAKAATLLQEIILADEAAGKAPPESQLQLWANCELKLKHTAGIVTTLSKLVAHYPKKDYWNDLIRQTQRLPGFSERLALDAYRLQRYAGSLDNADDLMEMAGLAMQAGFPAEAKQVIDQGYADKLLGIGAEEGRHRKLQEQASKAVAADLKTLAQDEKRAAGTKNGISSVNTGFNLVLNGQFEKGIALIEAGIAKGGLKSPDDAKLKLAMACLYAGQKEKALQEFKSITGNDGTTELARLWTIRINQK